MRHRKKYMQRLVAQQVLVGSASLWDILFNVNICLAKQIVPYLLGRPCERRLKKFIAFQALISKSQRSLERVKRSIEGSTLNPTPICPIYQISNCKESK